MSNILNDDDGIESTVVSTFEAMTQHSIYNKEPIRAPRPPALPRPKYIGILRFNDLLTSKRQEAHAIKALVEMLGVTAERAAQIIATRENLDNEPTVQLALNVAQVGALHAQFTRHDCRWMGIVVLVELRPAAKIIDVSAKRGASF